MGQEMSQEQIDPNTPPRTLSSRSIDGVSDFILEGGKKIVVRSTFHKRESSGALQTTSNLS